MFEEMKIKRFENLWVMGLILCAVILVAVYILKIFFPHFVVEVAQVESITTVGHYIDTHKWAWYLASFVLSFFVCYLTFCACCRKKYLSLKETIITVGCVLFLYVVKEFLPAQYAALNFSLMVFLPMLFKGDFKATAICFSTTCFLQTISLEIRGLSVMIADYNFATLIILMIDVYIFQVLLYLLFNYKKGEN